MRSVGRTIYPYYFVTLGLLFFLEAVYSLLDRAYAGFMLVKPCADIGIFGHG